MEELAQRPVTGVELVIHFTWMTWADWLFPLASVTSPCGFKSEDGTIAFSATHGDYSVLSHKNHKFNPRM